MRAAFNGVIGPGGIRGAEAGTHVLLSGHISNIDELRRRFGRAGDVGTTLARAFGELGDELQRHVIGEFALVVFDPATERGILTHDALGVVALFYSVQGAEILFATDLTEMASRIADDRLDEDYFADYLASGYVATARTPYRTVRRLLPGETVSVSRSGVAHHRNWDLADIAPLRLGSDAEYRARFRDLLDEAVAATVGANGATWVSLSGGLDSSTIACVAARQAPGRIGAYCLTIPGSPSANEEKWMRIVVDHAGIDWHPCDVETVLPFAELPDCVLGEPSVAVVNTAMRRSRHTLFKEHGVSVLLSGDAGDAILGAWSGPIPTHLADAFFSGHPGRGFAELGRWRSACHEQRSWTYWALRGVVAPTVAHLRARQVRSDSPLTPPPWMSPDYLDRSGFLARESRGRAATRCRAPGLQSTWDTLWAGGLSRSATAPDPYEVRYPYFHRPLVEFMHAIPWDQKRRPTCDRYLQRHALKGILPDAIRARGGKAIGTWPVVEGLARSRQWQDYLCDDPEVVGMGFTTIDAWRGAVAQAASGQTHGDRYFLTMVAFEVWLKMRRVTKARPGKGKHAAVAPHFDRGHPSLNESTQG